MFKNSLLTVSHPKHFHWLRTALRSLAKNASGWDEIILALPNPLTEAGQWIINDYIARNPPVPLKLRLFDEWEGKGKLCHMAEILKAPDYYPLTDYFFVWDSDMVMLEPTTCREFYRNGKPMLGWEWFDKTIAALPPVENWKKAAERATGLTVLKDYMRWFPIAHSRAALLKTREVVTVHCGMNWEDYLRAQQNTFPEGFAEFNTIGPVAERFCPTGYTFTRFPAYAPEDGTHNHALIPDIDPPALKKVYKGWGWMQFNERERELFQPFDV